MSEATVPPRPTDNRPLIVRYVGQTLREWPSLDTIELVGVVPTQCVILAVADTGPIIHFDEINAFGLLTAVDELLIPQTVYDELEGERSLLLSPKSSTISSKLTQPGSAQT